VDRKKVGLALGGGVARGMAHLGVLKVLVEAGIPIDYVAGTSAGSLVGSMYCAGMDLDTQRQFGEALRWWNIARPVWPRLGFVSFEPMRRLIVRQVGDLSFEDLKIPFCAVATDLDSGDPVPMRSGKLAPAVQASCAVPGIVEPVKLNGRLLGDGSLSDTVPVRILRAMGAEYVIGVDIFVSTIRPRWGPFGMGFDALEILVRRAGGGLLEADCLLTPRLAGKSYIRFSQKREYFLLGADAAREQLESIRTGIWGRTGMPGGKG